MMMDFISGIRTAPSTLAMLGGYFPNFVLFRPLERSVDAQIIFGRTKCSRGRQKAVSDGGGGGGVARFTTGSYVSSCLVRFTCLHLLYVSDIERPHGTCE